MRIERPTSSHPFASLLPHLFRGFRSCPYARCGGPSPTSMPSARLSARFVQEQHEEDTQEPGALFVKVIRLRNDGTEPWPENCQLVCIEGAPSLLLLLLNRRIRMHLKQKKKKKNELAESRQERVSR
jgi:hypothetical protein